MIVGAGADHHRQRAFPQARLSENPARSAFEKKFEKKILRRGTIFRAPAFMHRRVVTSPPTYPTDPPPHSRRPKGRLSFCLARPLPVCCRQARTAGCAPAERTRRNSRLNGCEGDCETRPRRIDLVGACATLCRQAGDPDPHGDDGGRCGMILTGAIVAGLLAAYLAAARSWRSRLAIAFGRPCSICRSSSSTASATADPPGVARRRRRSSTSSRTSRSSTRR